MLTICPACGTDFLRSRTNQIYCHRKCQKNSSRFKQNSKCSPTVKANNTRRFDRAIRLAEMLYTTPQSERLGFMRELIEQARSGKDKELRAILTMPQLLNPNPRHKKLFFRKSLEYCTISQAASNYCKKFWKANVKDVLFGRCPEPETGEVNERQET